MRNINDFYNKDSALVESELPFEFSDDHVIDSFGKTSSIRKCHELTHEDYLLSHLDFSPVCKPTSMSDLDEIKSILIFAGFANPECHGKSDALHLIEDPEDRIMNDMQKMKSPAVQTTKSGSHGKEYTRSKQYDNSSNQRPLKIISSNDIKNQDVLLGRGNRSNNHLGNKVYRKFVMSVAKQYKHCSRKEKTNLSNKIVKTIHKQGGRFLSPLTRDCRKWVEVNVQVSRRKISQALRDSSEYRFQSSKAA